MGDLRKIICFDLDGTLLDGTVHIWRTLYRLYVKNPDSRKKIMDDFFSGRINYREWFYADLENFRRSGVTREKILRCAESMSVMPGAAETLAEIRSRGHIPALISGGLDLICDHFFPEGCFDYRFINRLFFDEKGHISGGVPTPYDMENKAAGLIRICREEGISPARTVFVGDQDNDVSIAKAAGKSVAFNCKSERLRAVCDYEVSVKDMRRILPFIE